MKYWLTMNPTDFAVSRAIEELNASKGKGRYTQSDIATYIGASKRTVIDSIQRLLTDDRIKVSGKGKRGGYEYERSIFDYRSVS
jgi:predicted transcriptional regulator